jgi:nucleotide-binding universal stress UspA family protein
MFRRVLVAFDGSAGAREALTVAIDLSLLTSANVTVVAVEAHLPHYAGTIDEVDEEHEAEERASRRSLSEAEAYASDRGVEVTTRTMIGHPAHVIARIAAETGADLVVLGHSGHSAVWGRFLGGVTEKVSRHAPCSVLIVRHPPAAAP